jgi:DNA (cytosine-5)-methyltransferase 1
MAQVDYPAILEAAWQQHLAPRADNAPTVISTFAGAGGSSLGYSMAGYRELLAVEWDDNAVATFGLNFPGVPVYHGDICKLSVDECLHLAGLTGPRQLDVLDGSPPCQGFSTAGKRDMADDRNQLFREYVRLLRGLQPKVFVMENVSGLVKGKMKLIFADILRELKASGYVVSCKLLNAMYFNVPQSRERLIFIGVREDLGLAPSHPKAESRPIGPALEVDYAKNLVLSLAQFAKIDAHKKRQAAKGNGFSWQEVRSDRPSLAIVKNMLIGGANTRLVRCSDGWRYLTDCEIRQIGGYPAQFIFTDRDSMIERIGNSVPPLFLRSIARHIRTTLLGVTHG